MMVVKCVLVTGWFVVLFGSDAVTSVRLFHSQREDRYSINNAMSIFAWQIIQILKVFIRHDNYMAGAFTDKERIDKSSHKVIFENNIRLSHKGVVIFFAA